MYLTLPGLLKVIFSSRSTNDNIMQLHNWVIHLVFVHKFGSKSERMDLVETLAPYRKCLNKLSGVYLIRVGKVKDLREPMSICSEKYKPSKFDSAYVFKFGRSEDIMKRFKQHQERTGYGKYSSSVSLEWFVVIPPKLCSNAESELNKYFEYHRFKFEFNDGVKDHTELVIIKQGAERDHMKDKYFDLVKSFPGEANSIIQQMMALKIEHDKTIDNMVLQHDNELMRVKHDLEMNKSQHEKELIRERSEKELIRERSEKKDAQHQVAILELKLALALK